MTSSDVLIVVVVAVVVLGGPGVRLVRRLMGGQEVRSPVERFADSVNAAFDAEVVAERQRFESGTPAEATVTSVRPGATTVNTINVATVLGLHVVPSSGPAFDVEHTVIVMESTLPRVGQLIRVGFDPADHDRLGVEADWGMKTRGGLALKAYDAGSSTVPGEADRIAALTRLGDRREAGEITEEEFAREKARILQDP